MTRDRFSATMCRHVELSRPQCNTDWSLSSSFILYRVTGSPRTSGLLLEVVRAWAEGRGIFFYSNRIRSLNAVIDIRSYISWFSTFSLLLLSICTHLLDHLYSPNFSGHDLSQLTSERPSHYALLRFHSVCGNSAGWFTASVFFSIDFFFNYIC